MILIVDDDRVCQIFVSSVLKKAGYDVLTAMNGVAAMEMMTRGNIDLMLLDWEMPEMNGLETLAALRGNPDYRTLPVLMLSSAEHHDARDTALKAGANDFVSKPVTPDNLLSSIARYTTH